MHKTTWAVSGCLLFVLTACGGEKKAGGCAATDECGAGRACVSGSCRQLCVVQSDCAADQICFDGLCGEPAGGATPVITGVVGDDASDDSRVVAGVVVVGTHLDNAQFELRKTNSAEPLIAVEQTSTSATLALPIDVTSGAYTLVATNQAGSSEASVTLTLPEVTGTQIVSKLNEGGTTGIIVRARLPVGLSATDVAGGEVVADALDRIESLEALPSVGGNLIPNGNFEAGVTGWEFPSGVAGVVGNDTVIGPHGATYLQNPFNDGAGHPYRGYRVTSTTRIPVTMSDTYRVTGSFRVTDATLEDFGRIYLSVRAFNASGAEIGNPNGAPWWRDAISFHLLETAEWTSFAIDVGAGTTLPFSSDIETITIGVILNYADATVDAATPANRVIRVQGLGIYRVPPPAKTSWLPLNIVAGANYVPFDTTDGGAYAGWQKPQLRRLGAQTCLRGVVRQWNGDNGVAVPNDTVVALLPLGFRPSATVVFSTGGGWNPGTEPGPDRITIDTAGELRVRVSNNDSLTVLDGICFFVD